MDRGAESMLETLARTYFRQAGISVETQVHIDGVGYVDLLLEGRLIVELDGRHHGEWQCSPGRMCRASHLGRQVLGGFWLRFSRKDGVRRWRPSQKTARRDGRQTSGRSSRG